MEFVEKQKAEAVKRMKTLGILSQPIKEFEKEGKLNLSELSGFLYWLNEEEESLVDQFEEEYESVVYHVIKSFTDIGLMYSMLYVSKHEEEWEMDNNDLKSWQTVAYVYNKDMPEFSEFGSIGIQSVNGGLVRTW